MISIMFSLIELERGCRFRLKIVIWLQGCTISSVLRRDAPLLRPSRQGRWPRGTLRRVAIAAIDLQTGEGRAPMSAAEGVKLVCVSRKAGSTLPDDHWRGRPSV